MEDELRSLLRTRGWNMFTRVRKQKYTYYYAQKWKKDQVYLCTQERLPKITKEEVIEKLEKAEVS